MTLEIQLKEQARSLGFDLVGIAPATPADTFEHLRDWLDQGYAGDMAYMHRHGDARRVPSSVLPEVRSVVMVGMNYNPPAAEQTAPAAGKVARYAQGADYHDVLRQRLKDLLAWVQQQVPDCWGRAVVDTAPLLERDFARRAGLGWFGKNTMLLNKRLGSYFFLGALLLDIELQADAPHDTHHCGTCTACLDACPTQAFVSPHVLDARRCLSYLTIEHRGTIAQELRPLLDDWLFGCDVCQEVCPWNRKAPIATEPAFLPNSEIVGLDLLELVDMSAEEFRRRFRGTAIMRTGRDGLLRNAAIILGNRGDPAALPALRRALADSAPLVSEAAQWAIDRIDRRARSVARPGASGVVGAPRGLPALAQPGSPVARNANIETA